jgi:hypothetical protein
MPADSLYGVLLKERPSVPGFWMRARAGAARPRFRGLARACEGVHQDGYCLRQADSLKSDLR